jgi:hypothetical protein
VLADLRRGDPVRAASCRIAPVPTASSPCSNRARPSATSVPALVHLDLASKPRWWPDRAGRRRLRTPQRPADRVRATAAVQVDTVLADAASDTFTTQVPAPDLVSASFVVHHLGTQQAGRISTRPVRGKGDLQVEPPGGVDIERLIMGWAVRGVGSAETRPSAEQGQKPLSWVVTAGQRGDSPQVIVRR